MPATSAVVFTATVSVLLVVMVVVAGDTVSQEALSEVVNVADQVVGLETAIVWFGGFVAPCTALKVNDVGVRRTVEAAS